MASRTSRVLLATTQWGSGKTLVQEDGPTGHESTESTRNTRPVSSVCWEETDGRVTTGVVGKTSQPVRVSDGDLVFRVTNEGDTKTTGEMNRKKGLS